MFYTYILKSKKDKRYYIGYAEDLELRLERHNRGGVKTTRNRRPLIIVYSEKFESRIEAIRREREIKSYKGGQAFKKILGE